MPRQPTRPFSVMLREPAPSTAEGYVLKRWRISRARLPQNQHMKHWGACDYRTRTIVIHDPLPDDEFWSTLWHEVDHVGQHYLNEDAIVLAEFNRLEASKRGGLFSEDEE
jgi:hypothetical protein